MKTLKSIVLTAGLIVSGNTMATDNCPLELPTEKLLDCIVVEGAGDWYPTEAVLAEIRAEKAASKVAASENN
ncbi:MAG: hypothetical protein PVF52_00345 [Granulosicoccaceae bacterium]|jgi:hypothetical protein